jgi:acetolactate synthase-1/2/3 large subunit
MPPEAVVYADSGAHTFFTGHYWYAEEPGKLHTSIKYIGAMGWAIPAVIGAKLGAPMYPHVAIIGDGCMHMHGMEITTAANIKSRLFL